MLVEQYKRVKKHRIRKEINGYDVTVTGNVFSEAMARLTDYYFHDINESDYPTGEELKLVLNEATESLIDSYYSRELC